MSNIRHKSKKIDDNRGLSLSGLGGKSPINDNHPTDPVKDFDRSEYSLWRFRIISSIIIGYSTFYFLRLNFSMAIPFMEKDLGVSRMDIGWVLTYFSIIYGVGKFVNGFLADKFNPRWFMALSLLGSIILSFAIGFSSSIAIIGSLWLVNAWFQSAGWPPAAKLLRNWYAKRELGTKWSIAGSSHMVGAAIITISSGYILKNYGWEYVFIIPAAVSILSVLYIVLNVRQSPQSLSLPAPHVYKGDKDERTEKEKQADLTGNHDEAPSIIEAIMTVMSSKLMWYTAIANLFVYIARMGVLNWAPTFLQEAKGFEVVMAGWQLASYEIAGIIGGISAGYFSDVLFKGDRSKTSAIYMLGLIVGSVMLWKVPADMPGYNLAILFMLGFFIYGPQILLGVASADFTEKNTVGSAIGFVGLFGSIGTAIAGVGIAWIQTNYGWDLGFLFFIVCSVLGFIFILLTWDEDKRVKKLKAIRQKTMSGTGNN